DYSTDKILKLPMKEMEEILKDITTFWSSGELFTKYELITKRGILLYGPPGGGKTQIIKLITKHLIEDEKGVVFKIETPNNVYNFQEFMQSTYRLIEKDRKIVVIIEDIDGLMESDRSVETTLLNILDGTNHMNNTVYLATTNYPEKLED